MKKLLFIFCASFNLFVCTAAANSNHDIKVLESFLAETKVFTADFSQEIVGSDGILIQESSGTFTSQKPSSYQWITSEPEYTSLISNGKKVWFWDKELMQVIINSTENSNLSPAVLLATDIKELNTKFHIKISKDFYNTSNDIDCSTNDRYTCYQLTSKDEDSDFSKIMLVFDVAVLSLISLDDQLQNQTIIKFFNTDINKPLNENVFNFTPPKGVDVIQN